jgi:hypothetical protein
MSFKVWIGNVPIECETAADAFELAQKADGVAIPVKKPVGAKQIEMPGESRWTEQRIKAFFELIKSKNNQKKLIETLLAANAEGKTEDQLYHLLNLENGNALGGVTAGAAKNAKKVGADPDDLFLKRKVLIDGKKLREYFLTEGFRNAASRAGF